jgi:hypothetical protein
MSATAAFRARRIPPARQTTAGASTGAAWPSASRWPIRSGPGGHCGFWRLSLVSAREASDKTAALPRRKALGGTIPRDAEALKDRKLRAQRA